MFTEIVKKKSEKVSLYGIQWMARYFINQRAKCEYLESNQNVDGQHSVPLTLTHYCYRREYSDWSNNFLTNYLYGAEHYSRGH
jgi:hypothetical protein